MFDSLSWFGVLFRRESDSEAAARHLPNLQTALHRARGESAVARERAGPRCLPALSQLNYFEPLGSATFVGCDEIFSFLPGSVSNSFGPGLFASPPPMVFLYPIGV